MDILAYLLGKKAGGGGGEAVLIDKNIDANGTYNASDDAADGYKKVVVDVSASGPDYLDQLLKDTLTSYSNNTVTAIPKNAFYQKTALTSIDFPLITEIGDSAFYQCTNLGTVDQYAIFKNVTKVLGNALTKTAYKSIEIPKLNYVSYGPFLQESPNLELVRFGHLGTELNTINAYNMGNNYFKDCTKLTTLIIGWANRLLACGNVNNFNGTPFASGGTGGDIYIPKALYDHLGDGTSLDYKAASNWSTIDGYGTITWHAIEGSYYETHYADGTVIS